MLRIRNNKGFTLVETIVVITVIGVMAAVVVPSLTGFIKKAGDFADKSNLRLLNQAAAGYGLYEGISRDSLFSGIGSDAGKMQELIDTGFLDYMVKPSEPDAYFAWNSSESAWEVAWGDRVINGFAEAAAGSSLSHEALMSKNRAFVLNAMDYTPDYWNGYLEKLLQAGEAAGNVRIPENKKTNAIDYSNPFSGNKTIICCESWDAAKSQWADCIPPAVLITNDTNFDYFAADHDYIKENADTLKGAWIFYKGNAGEVRNIQIYYILKDGSLSDLIPAVNLFP